MKANRKTLMAVKEYLTNLEGYDLDELISEMIQATKLLKHETVKGTLVTDECDIKWDGKEICILSEFVDKYSEIFIENICNVLDKFIGEDISYYFDSTK